MLRWPLVPGVFQTASNPSCRERRGEAEDSDSDSVSLRRNIIMSAATTAAHSGRAGHHQGQGGRDSFNMDMLEVSISVSSLSSLLVLPFLILSHMNDGGI